MNPSGGPSFSDSWRARWLRRGAAAVAMLAVGLLLRAEHLSDWDSWDYAALAIHGHTSGLCLGRWWYIAAMRAAWGVGHALFGLDPLQGHLAMQAAGGLAMAGAVVVGMAWTYRLTRSVAAEALFAIVIVLGPTFGVYCCAVMTEALTLLMLGLAFAAWEQATVGRGSLAWAVAAGLAFGAMIDMREPAALLCAWPIVSCLVGGPPRRWRLLGAAFAAAALSLGAGVVGAAAWTPAGWQGYAGSVGAWIDAMADERELIGMSLLLNLRYLLLWMTLGGAVTLAALGPATVWALLRRRRMFWLSVSLVPYLLGLLLNHDLSVNPRFILPLMYVAAPVVAAAAAALLSQPAWRRHFSPGRTVAAAALVCGALFAVQWRMAHWFFMGYAEGQCRLYRAVEALPHKAVVVGGPATPMVGYLNRLGGRHLRNIPSGWYWPRGRLAEHLDKWMRRGRPVFANLHPGYWCSEDHKSGEWDELQAVAKFYRRRAGPWPFEQLLPRVGTTARTRPSAPDEPATQPSTSAEAHYRARGERP